MYGYDCAMCHGATGNGKGDVGATMNLKDYTDPAALHDLTDGQLFYIIQNGRGQMQGEAGRQNDQEIWNMVILVRSFSHK
jgi:mono/diheme cytochrome c family protein